LNAVPAGTSPSLLFLRIEAKIMPFRVNHVKQIIHKFFIAMTATIY
jgi:hypothetical protein